MEQDPIQDLFKFKKFFQDPDMHLAQEKFN
jgi:hypothetical protein